MTTKTHANALIRKRKTKKKPTLGVLTVTDVQRPIPKHDQRSAKMAICVKWPG